MPKMLARVIVSLPPRWRAGSGPAYNCSVAAAAVPASTVVLVRQGQREIEVLLVRRDDRIAFMGGAHVFPGGRVEARDSMEPASSSCAGIDAVASRMRTPRIQAMSFHVAAVRELFEEAGVLLARNERGALLTIRGGASPHFDQS